MARQVSGGLELERDNFHLLVAGERDAADRIALADAEEAVLYVPVERAGNYLKWLEMRGVVPLSRLLLATPQLDHSFEAFYIRDPEGNVLCFNTDGHGPYTAAFWDWSAEPKLTDELIKKYEARTFEMENGPGFTEYFRELAFKLMENLKGIFKRKP